MKKLVKTKEQWKAELSPEEFRIAREKGTERAFTGAYWEMTDKQGVYRCRCCDAELFATQAKYDSGSGWPSFYQPLVAEGVREVSDNSLLQARTEVLCSTCDAHLGHVFPDGPEPTGLRYCINSASLSFSGEEGQE